ncbi:hypothetical protein [Fodinicurvata halophila]|uniref:hypothetical protein n=1 Tax=Fodinicurvata halophila TaxID=1419723 RepID=UPI0036367F67
MLIRRKRGWEIPESQVTPEEVFRNRRRIIKAAGAGSLLLAGCSLLSACSDMDGSTEANAAEGGPSLKSPRIPRPISTPWSATTAIRSSARSRNGS